VLLNISYQIFSLVWSCKKKISQSRILFEVTKKGREIHPDPHYFFSYLLCYSIWSDLRHESNILRVNVSALHCSIGDYFFFSHTSPFEQSHLSFFSKIVQLMSTFTTNAWTNLPSYPLPLLDQLSYPHSPSHHLHTASLFPTLPLILIYISNSTHMHTLFHAQNLIVIAQADSYNYAAAFVVF
jgi:hypothetical protein